VHLPAVKYLSYSINISLKVIKQITVFQIIRSSCVACSVVITVLARMVSCPVIVWSVWNVISSPASDLCP